LRSWYIANYLRRNRFSAASAPCGRMMSQMNLNKSRRRQAIVLIKSMMVYIMSYQVWKCDALETPILIAMGPNFCGGQRLFYSYPATKHAARIPAGKRQP
jgi:hypothetical protein